MTSTGMPRDIDRILDAWFEDGPTLAADRVVGAALAEVEQVSQARPRTLRARTPENTHRMAAWQLLAATVGIAITLLGIGFATGVLRIDRNPPPGPIESSQPTPSQGAAGFTMFSSETDGYELLIPTGWVEVTSEHPDARQWAGPDGDLMISYGTSIFEGGEVTVCAPPGGDLVECMTLDHGFSVPFDPEIDGVGPIDLEVWLDRCDGACPLTTTDVSLDGESADEQRAVIKEQQLTYVTTFHNRRPIILYWSEPVADADESRVQQMLRSFRFLEPPLDGSPAPFIDPTELVAHVDSESAYEILVPRYWEESAQGIFLRGSPFRGVTRFGAGGGAGTGLAPGLTISIGNPDGSLFICHELCERVVVTTMDELEVALTSVMDQGPIDEVSGELTLGGEAGRWERPHYQQTGSHGDLGIGAMTGGGNCLGCPDMRYQAFTFHNGRPIVLAFDYWNIAFERLETDYVAQMIESFRFLD
jgi:hypothetical protein